MLQEFLDEDFILRVQSFASWTASSCLRGAASHCLSFVSIASAMLPGYVDITSSCVFSAWQTGQHSVVSESITPSLSVTARIHALNKDIGLSRSAEPAQPIEASRVLLTENLLQMDRSLRTGRSPVRLNNHAYALI